MLVEITKEDIRKGLTRSHTLGAVNLAIRRAITKEYGTTRNYKVLIHSRDMGFVDGLLIYLPPHIQEFIALSDDKKDVFPCEFEIDLPEDLFPLEAA